MDYKQIITSDGTEIGIPTGSTHKCRMEGCNGLRITTKWSDGKITHPCSMELLPVNIKKGIYRIG